MPNSQAPAHWSKDFVEHLRTIHFTLIALCVGLIVLASFPSKTEIQVAHEQVSEILEVVNTWKLRERTKRDRFHCGRRCKRTSTGGAMRLPRP